MRGYWFKFAIITPLLFLAGCDVTIPPSEVQPKANIISSISKPQSIYANAIEVGSVNAENFCVKSIFACQKTLTNEDFKKAIEDTLSSAGFLSKDSTKAKYRLEVEGLNLNYKGKMGLWKGYYTYDCPVRYKLIEIKTGKEVYNDIIKTSAERNSLHLESAYGVAREQSIALRQAISENIVHLIRVLNQ